MAYVDAAVSLATFVEERGLPRRKIRTVMACAGTVTAQFRQILERVFAAEVFDKYGSRDCADIACECAAHHGLHIYAPNVFVEVVDSSGQPCSPGETGRILVTLLTNLSFPMIRYQIGDMGIRAEPGPCPCGLAFPRLQSLQGREDDMLALADGTLLSSSFIRHFVGVALNRQLIREWQFEQTGLNEFVFRYIPLARLGLEKNLEQLRESFGKVLGGSAGVQFCEVPEIPPTPTGKTRWIMSRVKREKIIGT
jgi:phenylacetate-CoA ligase